MIFLKKFLLGIGAFFLILIGGAGTQSNSTLLQGGGFLGLILGLVVLYIFAKMAWRAMGCLPSIIVIVAIVLFIMYAIGSFKGGINNIIPNLKSFIGYNENQKDSKEISPQIDLLNEEEFDIHINENFSSADGQKSSDVTESAQSKNLIQQIFGETASTNNQMNPRNFPVIYSSVKVLSADTFIVNGHYFRLYGIDAPESNQTCSDYYKRPYYCGKEASSWLRSWIQNNEIECRVMQQDANGNMIGVCFFGEYDIGAALVNAGWAVVYNKHTDIYMPYQNQARRNANGLWQGEFYMPWDWRKIQSRKPQIKIINKKPKRKRTFLNPLG